ncbi:MAG: hypothetical protein AAGH71_02805 [Planctomycetota bacterium]
MIEWLFGIDRLDPADPAVRLEWAWTMPGWAWLVVCLAVAALCWWSYRGLAGRAATRAVLAGARTGLLLTLLLLLAGPKLTRTTERTEPDWIVTLIDRSASLTIADAPAESDPSTGSPITREEQLRGVLDAYADAFASVGQSRSLLTLGFDAGAFELVETGPGQGGLTASLGEADGGRTLLGASLDTALDSVVARPVAGVLVLSDGASTDTVSRRAMQRLRAERIPVHVLPLGSPDPVRDLRLARVEAPDAAFVRDRVPVRVRIERTGGGIGQAEGPDASASVDGGVAWVELVEVATDRVLDRVRVPSAETGDGVAEVTLTAQPDIAGEADWAVRLVPDGPDLLAENNAASLTIRLVDQPLRVLHTDGGPRWEFRYLKNLLLRERSILSSSLLLTTGRRHIREGPLPIDSVPVSPGDWEGVDIMILGDVRADLFSAAQLEAIRSQVADRGMGLLFVAGPEATPESWVGTPLEALLPLVVRGKPGAWSQPVTLQRGVEAERLGLLALSDEGDAWPDRLSRPETGWSLLRWAQRFSLDQVKPTASVLASFAPATGDEPPSPAVLSMRYGAGRVVYIATDEIWRWRYARGEALPERFWIPILRLLGRETLAPTSDPAVLAADPAAIELGDRSVISLRLLDAQLVSAAPSTLRARVVDDGGQPVADLPLQATGEVGASRRFDAVWTPSRPGRFAVVADDPSLGGVRLTEDVEVFAPDDERRRSDADHAALGALAEASGGRVLSREDLTSLSDLFPNRSRTLAGIPDEEDLWDAPWALILLIVLLSTEWIGRRILRLA